MANPLQELSLKPLGFQFIQELPINATPEKVWASVLNVGGWFGTDADRSKWAKSTLEATPGGRWIVEGKDGATWLQATVMLVEPNKLLRVAGSMGMTHLPLNNVVIFELQPKDGGKTTLLRLGHRGFGYMDAEVEGKYRGGWAKLLPNIKQMAETR